MIRPLILTLFIILSLHAASGMEAVSHYGDGFYGQDSVFRLLERDMAARADDILYGESDSVRLSANLEFSQILLQALGQEGSFQYPFDSLTTISRLFAPDSSFRILTWNLPKDDGTYVYSGVIQCRPEPPKETVFILSDSSDTMAGLERVITGCQAWPGAHYYQVILNEIPAEKYYTLLGWDGHTRFTTRKIIDVLTFDQHGQPVFGAPVFPDYLKGDQARVIFEYSANATMSLKYEIQRYRELRNKNRYRPRYRYKTARMIVFDHLEPMDPSLKGQFSFYVPAGNIVDAFVFLEGCWRFKADVDARNPDFRSSREKDRPTEYQLMPPGENK